MFIDNILELRRLFVELEEGRSHSVLFLSRCVQNYRLRDQESNERA